MLLIFFLQNGGDVYLKDEETHPGRDHDMTDSPDCKLEGPSVEKRKHVLQQKLNQCECEYCDYSTMQAGNLKQHFNVIHKGIKPYQDELDNSSSTGVGSLRVPVDRIHKGIKLHQCQTCSHCSQLLVI